MNNIKLITLICVILAMTTLLKLTKAENIGDITILPLVICFLIILIIFYKLYNGKLENFAVQFGFLNDNAKMSKSYDGKIIKKESKKKNKLILNKNFFTYQGHPNRKIKKKQKDGPYIDYNSGSVDGTDNNNQKKGMFMFRLNKFDPECSSIYHNSQGKACLTDNQIEFLNKRGKPLKK